MSKKFLGFNIADYWHVEMYVITPFMVWFIWRVETIVYFIHTVPVCHL